MSLRRRMWKRSRSHGSADRVLITVAALLGTGGLVWLVRRWLSPGGQDQLSPADRHFIDDAIRSGLEEIELGHLAMPQTQNAEVRRFGQIMVRDHSRLNSELRDLSFKKGHVPPNTPSARQKPVLSRLSRSCGPDFDRLYLGTLVDHHRQAVAMFEREAESGDDPDLRAWAQRNVGTLQDHLNQALRLSEQLKQGRQPLPDSGPSI